MAVDQVEPTVGQFGGEQTAGEADLLIQGAQGILLVVGVQTIIPLVRHRVAGAHAAVALDAVPA
jgi:hypothetical protein